MPAILVQAQLQAFTELPRDRFTNTWVFASQSSVDTGQPNTAAPAGDTLDLAGVVAGFYENVDIGGRIPSYVLRAFSTLAYDLFDPTPRVPTIATGTMPVGSATSLPGEVAVCLGFRGAPPHTGRRRGRVFIGPLEAGTDVVSTSGSAAFPSVAVDFRNDLLTVYQTLVTAANGFGYYHVVRSLVGGDFTPITEAYVDEEFDTQRRRGFRSTTRSLAAITNTPV